MSPLSEVPSVVVLGTPPNSISRIPRFTSSFPAQKRFNGSVPGAAMVPARRPTVDGGEEAGAQVVVKVLVLAHFKHFLPLLLSHLALDALCRLLLLSDLLPTKL